MIPVRFDRFLPGTVLLGLLGTFGCLFLTGSRLEARPAGPEAAPAAMTVPAADSAAIDEAIRRGVEYLLRMQRIDGSWSRDTASCPGYTALCALALYKAGLPKEHPAIEKALNYVAHRPVKRTYDVAVLITLLKEVDPEKHADWIKACAEQLIETQSQGLWAYPSSARDMSNTQYAALGLRSAAATGVKVNREVWKDLLEKTVFLQCEDGGWGYRQGSKPTGSMTCAALTCLLICREELEKQGRGVSARSTSDEALESGLAWMDRHFVVNKNPRPHEDAKHSRWLFYYLYGVERLGALSGRKTFGDKDWYSKGSEWLVKKQGNKGQWGTAYGEPEMNTPFAILFMTRATLSSFTRHQALNRIKSTGKGGGDIVLGCDRGNPGYLWIESWSQKVADKYGIDGGKKAIRVEKVAYYAGTELLAEVTEDPTGGRITRFPLKYHFEENGDKEISAMVYCRSLAGTVAEPFASGKLKLYVHNNLSDADRACMEDVRNNLVTGLEKRVEVSSTWGNDWSGGRALDGRQGTSWLSAKPESDGAPWIKVSFPDPPRANMLKLTHTISHHFEPKQFGRAVQVLVHINRGSQKIKAELGSEDGVKYEVPFRTTRVRDIKIEMLEREKGVRYTAAGFAEIELFMKPKR
jgi:hypothetical protein